MPPPSSRASSARAGAVFDALADPTRRRIVELLGSAPASATDLSDTLPVSRQAIVKHLLALEDAHLVRGERAGRRVVYQLTPAPLNDAARWMHDVGSAWDRRLADLAARLKKSR